MKIKYETLKSMMEQSGYVNTAAVPCRAALLHIWEDDNHRWRQPWFTHDLGQGYCELWMPVEHNDETKLWDDLNS